MRHQLKAVAELEESKVQELTERCPLRGQTVRFVSSLNKERCTFRVQNVRFVSSLKEHVFCDHRQFVSNFNAFSHNVCLFNRS